MFRYVALLWNDADEAARQNAQQFSRRLQGSTTDWQTSFDEAGLRVFCTGLRPRSSEVYLLAGGRGIVLGKLFRRTAVGSITASEMLDHAVSEAIVRSGGRHLIENYWGRYVAFLCDPASRTVWIVRDPSAGLPAQHVSSGGVAVYVSFVEDAVALGLGPFTVDWDYVAATLCYTRLQLRATGLKEVSQVLGGECVQWQAGTCSSTFLWNPLRVAETDPLEDPQAAAQRLREQAKDCIHAWAACYEGILHTLSGGLDSSIVLGCLQDAPTHPRITALNYYSPGSDTDERVFARAAAIRADCELIERERRPFGLEEMLRAVRTAIPENYLYHVENSRQEAQLAAERQAQAIFSGGGGDQLFYQARGAFSAADFLSRRGLRPGLFGVALDAARMDRLSVWAVLGEAIACTLRGKRWDPTAEAGEFKSLISPEVLAGIRGNPRFLHPWFQSPGRVPAGKLWHAFTLLRPHEFYDPMGSPEDPERLAPLTSQPLVETALRIPTYVLTAGGWDRAIARRAFREDVPPVILNRQTKGGVEEHSKAVLVRNLTFVRGLLLDGLLVRQKILSRAALEAVLSGGPSRTGSSSMELYECLSMEAWLHSWQNQRTLAAA